ncbi:MAG TPA: hypothetical protein ENL05_00600 [Candidatus Moranbacteria bacterium]|nr:hypothetical protein [Candidatus Moranbacteria bacterium]
MFESPKKQGKIKADIYQVETVALKKGANQKETLVLKGKGLPNSFVNVYIYSSQPIILVVKTDKNGNWSYTLSKPLENGKHQVYVAITDNTGKITAKSRPLAFVKTAQAVSITPATNTYISPTSSTDNRKKYNLAVAVVLALISLGLAISIIGIIVSKSKAKRNK